MFGLIFIISNIIIYWISPGVRNRYLYIFYPFVLTPIAYFFLENYNKKIKFKTIIETSLKVFLIILPIALFYLPFFKDTKNIDNIWLISIILSISSALLAYYHFKFKKYRIYTFVFLLIIARFSINFVQMPALQINRETTIFQEFIDNINKITKDKPVHYTGYENTLETSFALGPLKLSEVVKKQVSPLNFGHKLAAQLYLQKGKFVKFDTIPYDNTFYIIPKKVYNKEYSGYPILYQFFEKTWIDEELVLIKYKKK